LAGLIAYLHHLPMQAKQVIPGNNVRPMTFKKLLLLTDMVRDLLLPNYEDWAMNSISRKPRSRSFIRKLTFQN
jgi:hypothetical protein